MYFQNDYELRINSVTEYFRTEEYVTMWFNDSGELRGRGASMMLGNALLPKYVVLKAEIIMPFKKNSNISNDYK